MIDKTSAQPIRELVDDIYQSESRRIFASLVRLLGDFDLAEDALHDAFRAAMEQWPRDGVPANPRAWLISTGRFKAIDALRRRTRFEAPLDEESEWLVRAPADITAGDIEDVQDDRLRLIFTCCHPLLVSEVRVALTLREVCGLTTEEIAHAFLASPTTLAQRIVRAKAKIRDEHIPYLVPSRDELPERLEAEVFSEAVLSGALVLSGRQEAVLQVIYLVFNEGYSASRGDSLTRPDLSSEAIRLARLLVELLPDPEVEGLLALMLLHESRRAARTSPRGDLVLLENQDRSLWNREMIAEGTVLTRKVFSSGRIGPYSLQAAIAAVHSAAPDLTSTDWPQIVGLYDLLMQIAPSSVVEINRAVALAMRDGPAAGLALVDAILARGALADYHLAYAARGELCRRMGKIADAHSAYQRALALTEQAPERRFLEQRLHDLPE